LIELKTLDEALPAIPAAGKQLTPGRVQVLPAARRPVGSLRHRVHRIFCDHGEGKAEGPINAVLALYVRTFHEIAERWDLRA
jgi:hypothetical protein